jgi:hypothetical protein
VGGAAGPRDFKRITAELENIQSAIRDANLGGWLLYDLHARNDVTAGLIGMGDMTRRFFVLIPAQGEPTAIVHGIEEAPWGKWPWQKRVYVGWSELGRTLGETLSGVGSVAMEFSENSAVPAVDHWRAGGFVGRPDHALLRSLVRRATRIAPHGSSGSGAGGKRHVPAHCTGR